ncbi:hypothetical protein ACFQ1S_31760, partial [Kibdelosporangium lantanae]
MQPAQYLGRVGVWTMALEPQPAAAVRDVAAELEDLGYYMTYFEARTTLDLDGWELMYNLPAGNGVQGRVALVYPLGNNGRVRVMLAFVSPDLNHDRRDTDAQKKLLARVFAGAGWEVPNLIEQMWTAEDLYFERVGAVHVPEWYRGRT